MQRMRIFLLLTATLLACPALAQSKIKGTGNAREAFYRCKDAKGALLYADSLPASCLGHDIEVLSERGSTLRVIEGDQSRGTRLEREATEQHAVKLREEREQWDKMLIDTYLSVADIERLRDQRLEMLAAQFKITQQSIENLRERQNRLESQIARFRPYSDRPNALPLPDHLAEEMVNTAKGRQVYQEMLSNNNSEQIAVKAGFDAEIKRFKELKGIK
jgi:hypothetical protein